MAQKVQFIATVLNRPELLILDEPFSGLDPVNAEVLKDAVLDLKRRGTTVVFSTHDMAVAERLCDRIFMIFKGKKVLDGTLDEIQAIYGYDTIRVRTEAGARRWRSSTGSIEVNDLGNIQEVRWAGDPQDLLQALAARTRISHFEITRPSLHDIFVRIAAPDRPPAGDRHAMRYQTFARSGWSRRPSSGRRSGPSRSSSACCCCRSSWGRRSCSRSSWPSGRTRSPASSW